MKVNTFIYVTEFVNNKKLTWYDEIFINTL